MGEWLKPTVLKTVVPQGTVGSNPTASSSIRKHTMSYVLFLDDVRNPDDVTWEMFPRDEMIFTVRNYNAFVKHVMLSGVPGFVCFDHDLADEHYEAMLKENESDPVKQLETIVDYGSEKTGYDCAKWLVDYCEEKKRKFPPYIVHSMNPAGKERIAAYIENAKKHLGI